MKQVPICAVVVAALVAFVAAPAVIAPALAAAGEATVNLGRLYVDLEPYFVQAVGALIIAGVGWLIAVLQKRTGIVVDEHLRAIVQQAAINAATKAAGELEGPITAHPVDVGSPAVAKAINYLNTQVGPELKKLGYTPEKVANLAAAKLGALQHDMQVAQATFAPPPGK